MNPPAAALLFCLPAAAMAGSSAHYTLSPEILDGGGGRVGSADYTADFSLAPGGAGGSPAYTFRTGFAGQLEETAGLQILLDPAALNETGAGQLRVRLLEADGHVSDLPPSTVTWSILSGPIAGVTPDGLVTAETVYQTGTATVQGTAAGFTASLTFTVNETIPDNFGIYAGDRLPDAWQVRHLGLSEPEGGPAGDPDRDGLSNLLEFAFGTDPGDSSSGSDDILYSGGVLIARGQPVPVVANIPNSVDFRAVFGRRRDWAEAGLLYQVQFSADLLSWIPATGVPLVLAQDAEIEAAGVTWPFFLNGRKARFFRVTVGFTPLTP